MKQKILFITCILLIANIGTTLAEKTSPTNRAMITPLQPVQTQPLEQVALVIGNNDYGFMPLQNAVNDATRVASVLKQKGFKVILKTNLDYARMEDAVREFGAELASKKDVGLLFYAGHGVQIGDKNFLIPTNNREMRDEMDVQNKAVDVHKIMQRMVESQVKLSVIILDACRDNPFKPITTSRSLTRGLTSIQAAEGMIIAYATAPGATATDEGNGQGLYTEYLVETLQEPGLEIEKVFKEVSRKVKAASKGKQKPWYNASVDGTFCFGGCESLPKPTTVTKPPIVTLPTQPTVGISGSGIGQSGNPVTVETTKPTTVTKPNIDITSTQSPVVSGIGQGENPVISVTEPIPQPPTETTSRGTPGIPMIGF